jgi:hypothetical protein
MDKFSLDELLRYFLAGGLSFATMLLAYEFNQGPELAESSIAITSVAVVLLGSLIYVLHRAIIYPLLYRYLGWPFRRQWPRCWAWLPYLCDQNDVEIDKERWSRRNHPQSVRGNLAEWGSQVHYLYCATWAVTIGLVAGEQFATAVRSKAQIAFWWLAGILLAAAIIHHLRFLYFDSRVSALEKQLKPFPAKSESA